MERKRTLEKFENRNSQKRKREKRRGENLTSG